MTTRPHLIRNYRQVVSAGRKKYPHPRVSLILVAWCRTVSLKSNSQTVKPDQQAVLIDLYIHNEYTLIVRTIISKDMVEILCFK